MSSNDVETTDTAGREMVITKVLQHPREKVFAAWVEAGQVAQWWGPRGFTTTMLEMDVRPGGRWRFIMHGPDGTDYPNRMDYLEVDSPSRLVYLHGDDSENTEECFETTVTFAEQDGGTLLTMRVIFPTVEHFERVKSFGAVELGNQTMDCLAEFLASAE